MGGDEELDAQAQQILKELQNKLNNVLEKLAQVFADSLRVSIQESMRTLSENLQKVKGPSVPKANVTGEQSFISWCTTLPHQTHT